MKSHNLPFLIRSLLLFALVGLTTMQELKAQLDPSKVIFFRNTGAVKSATSCLILEGDSVIAKIKESKSILLDVLPGSYTLRPEMSMDQTIGMPLRLKVDARKLYVIEVKLHKQSQQKALPSAGYYFKLVEVDPKRIRSFLKRKIVKEAIQEALFEDLLHQFESSN